MTDLQRQRALERRLLAVRWAGVLFGVFQVLTYYRPYPPGVLPIVIAVVAMFGLCTAALTVLLSSAQTERDVARVGMTAIVIDTLALFALVFCFTFDVNTAMFAIVYLLPVEAAMRYGLRGALWMMVVCTALYVAREVWGHVHYGFDLLPASISFRMGIGVLIAVAAGSMADAWRREHRRVETALHQERRATEALRRLDELKTTFLSSVSHELRTPLTSILGFAITLQDQATELTPRHRTMLEHIAGEADQLNRILRDLLDVNRMLHDSDELDVRLVDVGTLVDAVARRVARAAGRQLDLDVAPIRARVDPGKLEKVVENLVANACKFSPERDSIRVCAAASEGGLLLSVEDRGPGVPEPLRRTIFEPFQQAGDGAPAHAPGTGIGLSLVDRFSRLHGGTAWVEERPGGGASFRVFLPGGGDDGALVGDGFGEEHGKLRDAPPHERSPQPLE